MSLTPAQKSTILADIQANPDLGSQPMTHAGCVTIAELYNTVSATDVWKTDASVQDVYDAIDWSKYTPTDAPDSTTVWMNRALAIQTKQMNLQNMLMGRATLNAAKANIRAGLRDAVIALPAGAGGNTVTAGGAGGVTVLTALLRKALRIEKVFATVDATTGPTTAKLLVWEGPISVADIEEARGI